MITLGNLEIHVVHSCNLACESCSHYSNQAHKGILSLGEAEDWMSTWSRRLRPRVFSLLGGEPSIHPDLTEFFLLCRRQWPKAVLRLVTNGFFLHRHPDLPRALANDPNAWLCFSIHHASPEYQAKLQPICHLLNEWKAQYGIRIEVTRSYEDWTQRYKGFGSAMEPFDDGQPRKSWEICRARYCRQLFEGKIWKCAPLTYLKMQDAKYKLSTNWQAYLKYAPLEPSATDEEVQRFFRVEEESYCGMCPANRQKFELPVPFISRMDVSE